RIGGERAKQIDGFDNLKLVLLISLLGIYLALLIQFNNAVKPILVFAAAPYGVVGSLIALSIMHTPFGFMAFLGIASLIGVIVSHVIVLFDFIEEMHAKGEPLEQALADAGIQRIRPVMITVVNRDPRHSRFGIPARFLRACRWRSRRSRKRCCLKAITGRSNSENHPLCC